MKLFKNLLLAIVMFLALFTLCACGRCKHENTEWRITTEATCYIEGHRDEICQDCEERLGSKSINPLGHEETTIPAVDPTCKEEGHTEGVKCSRCGEVLYEVDVLPTISHTYDDEYDAECNKCDHIRDALCRHAETETIKGYSPTCTSGGYTDGEKCKSCGEYIVYQEYIPAIGHSFGNWMVVLEPTCTKKGEETRICTCGKTETRDKVLAHNWNAENTCTYCSKYKDKGLIFTFDRALSTYSVSDYVGTAESVIIPSTYNGYAVTSIAHQAFYSCHNITNIEVPSSVTSIGYWAFSGCSSLTSIKVDSDNPNYKDIDGNLYTKDGKAIIQYAIGKNDTSFTIPSSVTIIGNSAFRGCSSLTSIEIPDSVTSIGEYAFLGCTNLANVEFTENSKLTSIGDYAFAWCSNLTSIVIPDSVTSIGEYAFYWCTSLTSIEITDGVTSIGDYAFYNCYKLVEVINKSSLNITARSSNYGYVAYYAIEVHDGESKIANKDDYLFYTYDGVNHLLGYIGNDTDLILPDNYNGESYAIYNYAFYENNKITSIVIGNSVTIIGYDAFAWCSNLTSIVIPGSVTNICGYAFRDCSSLTSIEIPDGVTSIGDYAFYNCYKLVEVINKSSLNITAGSSDYGYVAYYAIEVHNGESKIVNKDDYLFYTYDGINYLLGYVGDDTNLILPDNYNSENYEIYKYAFENCTSLTSIVIPDSVTSIGDCAFYDCKSLTSVEFAENSKLTSIGSSAFSGCSSLTSIVIPDGVTSIDGYAFDGCSSLTSVVIGNGVRSIGNSAFSGCSSLTSIVSPDSVTSIGDGAFCGCYSLTSVVIGDSVTSIGSSAFYGCYKLVEVINKSSLDITAGSTDYGYVARYAKEVHNGESKIVNKDNYLFYTYDGINYLLGYVGNDTDLILPDNYNGENYEIYKYAFYGCTSLTSAVIPDSVTSIGSDAFYGCSSLTSVYITDMAAWCNISFSNSVSNPIYNGADLYLNGELVTELTIPDTVTTINNSAFYNCTSLTSVVIPDSVTSIGSYAFYGCSSLRSIVICDSVTSIGSSAFSGCSSLASIEIPDSVTSIGGSAFYGCTSLANVEFTENSKLTSIGDYAFSGCSSLTSIEIPDSVTSIGDGAFYNCTSLISATFAKNSKLASIGDHAFWCCSSLMSMEIPDSVTNIGYSAFSDCSSLTSITIPFVGSTKDGYNDTHFGYIFGAQSHKTNDKSIPASLKTIIITGGTGIDENAFYGCSGLTSVIIGEGVKWIGDYAFKQCTSLASIVIPESVWHIKDIMFDGCISLSDIYFTGGRGQWNLTVYYYSEDSFCFDDATIHYSYGKPDSVDGYVYELQNDGTYWITLYTGTETEVIIPSSYKGATVTGIGDWAFANCTSITSIVIASGVTSIGNYAFSCCWNLERINIPNSVTTIGEYTFDGCDRLTSVVIGNGVTSIGNSAFYYCTSLTSIKYRGTEEQWNAISKSTDWDRSTGDYTITYNYTGE